MIDFGIVDAHHHLWDLSANYHPWLCDEPLIVGRHGDYSPIRRNYLADDFRNDWDNLPIIGSVYVEAEWDPSDPVGETRWIHSLAVDEGIPSAIVAQAWLDREDTETSLAQQASFERVRSVRHKPMAAMSAEDFARNWQANEHAPPGSMSDPRWRDGFALLEAMGLAFDLQVPYWHLGEAAALARAFPRQAIILNHTGLPSDRSTHGLAMWREGMAVLAGCDNVRVKVSGLCDAAEPAWSPSRYEPIVLDVIDLFGCERVMFASNYPVDSLYASYVDILQGFAEMTASFPPSQRERMFAGNAREAYGF